MARRYKRITYEDRKQIAAYVSDGVSITTIAERLGVSRATLYRELARGGCEGGREMRVSRTAVSYDPDRAQRSI